MQRLTDLLSELHAISPMPSDEELEERSEEGAQQLDRYVQVIEAIRQEVQTVFPVEAIPALLSSFGSGDGGEVYWSTVHLLEAYPDETILYRFVQQACQSPYPGTRKWCCLLLGRRRSLEDLPFFLERLRDEIPAVRKEALLYGVGSLAEIYPLSQAIPTITELLQDEENAIQKAARKVLAQLQATNNP